MTQILRHKKILLIIALNLVIAFLIAFIAEWLSYKNSFNSLTGTVNQQSTSLEVYKPYIFSLFKVYPIIVLLLLSLSFVLIKTTKPILEDLLFNEKDLVNAQNNAKKNEKALLTLMKNLPVGLVLYDISGDITQYNDYAINYLGFTRNQYKIKGLIGPSLHLIREDGTDVPINEYPLNNVIANTVILKNKVGGIVGKSGNIVWVKYNAYPVFGYFGRLKQVIVTFTDITDQKEMEISLKDANGKLREQAEELTQLLDNLNDTNTKLSESEARYKLISDFSNSWEIFRHPDGKLIYCSPYIEQIIGYTREEYLTGIPFTSFIHPDDLNEFTERFNKALSGKLVSSCLVRLIHKNQEVRWVDSEMRPVFSETGELLGTRYSIWDITKLKETELALQESRELLNLIFQYSSNWESYSDKNGNLIFSSNAFEQLLGYQVKDYISRKIGIKDIVHPDDYEMARSQLELARTGKTIPSHILRYVHKNKNIVWVDVSTRPVFSESGEMLGIRFSSKDITKLKEYESALKDLNATKDKFFSVISHDLRSPFTGLLGYSELLYNDYNRSSEETIKNYVSNIYSLSKNTFDLLENLLAWSQSQTGKIALNQKKIHLKPYSDAIIQMINPIAQKKKIILTNSITENIYAYADENMLHTIFRNLISNAIKYTYESGTINLRAKTENSVITISVSDTGVGMSEDIKNSLFKISETKSQPGTQSEKGTGLGLILCKEFVEKHGGKIWVESDIGKGTTFFFTIPCISS
jgi:Signal transduction histidine kinase